VNVKAAVTRAVVVMDTAAVMGMAVRAAVNVKAAVTRAVVVMDTAAAVMEVVMAVMVDMAVSTAAREMAGEEVVRE
jgi:hypothetical protein